MAAEPWRVAQIVADRGAAGGGVRGSGYLVRSGLVLTAAHVLAGASAVRVRLDIGQPTEIEVRAERWWADRGGQDRTDLAVIMIPDDLTTRREVEPSRFGRISDRTAVLTVKALGFPLLLARLLLPGILERRYGRIISISSLAGHTSFPYTEAYAAAKDGLTAFSRVLHTARRPRRRCHPASAEVSPIRARRLP